MYTVLGFSGGKDSAASVLLAWLHSEPLDEIICSVPMFDKTAGMPADAPIHVDFIMNTAKPFFERLGYKFTIVRGKKDYLDVFNHVVDRPRTIMEHQGMRSGFPGFCGKGKCAFKRDCKTAPMERYENKLKKQHGEITKILGIAIDEPERLKRDIWSKPNVVSLLEKYNYTEEMAYDLCKRFGLLSPTYFLGDDCYRGGCWCCAFSKECEKRAIFNNHRESWDKYVALEDYLEDVIYKRWSAYDEMSLRDYDNMFRQECGEAPREVPQNLPVRKPRVVYKQYSIFDWFTDCTA